MAVGNPPTVTYGFIGLGIMGYGMAKNLRASIPDTSTLYVCELVKERRDQWMAEMATTKSVAAASPREIASRCDVIITMLPRGPHVWTVFTDSETGLLSDLSVKSGKLFLECSTIDVKTSLSVCAEVEKSGLGIFVDAPVSGGVKGADTGALAFMVGSPLEHLPRVEAVARTMGRPETIFHCGGTGSGLATKQINNYMSAVNMIGVCEGMSMGAKYGLDPIKLASVINVSTGMSYNSHEQNPVKGVSPTSSAARDFAGGFSTELCQGVLEMALELRRDLGTRLVLGDKVDRFYSRAIELDECKGKDFRSIYKLFTEEEGIKKVEDLFS